jgi:hypothetical protein
MEQEWQPIETAPKSGLSILCTLEGGDDGPYWVAFWNDLYWESAETGNDISKHFTHWRFIPMPPEAK